jgi:pyrimidine operon attenuation protein / uracil phosphoribosyltransferase
LKSILTQKQIELTVKRLAHQVLENHLGLENTVLIGIQPRGIFLSDRIVDALKLLLPEEKIFYGKLDITFYRDDIRNELKLANATQIPFSTAGKNIVMIDDVLWTGRTIRSALDALIDFGRPSKVELCVLIDRRFSRELPIQADYIGRAIDTFPSQKVFVRWKENFGKDEVILE